MESSGGLRIGIVASRLGGTDGVSTEAAAWSRALESLGHEVWSFAGHLGSRLERCRVVPLAFFGHPDVQKITSQAFSGSAGAPSDLDLGAAIETMTGRLQDELHEFVRASDLQLLIAENVLALPVHLPLGIALTRLAADTGIAVLAHHHDLPWERERFAITSQQAAIEEAFPPRLPNVYHVCINSHQRSELERRIKRVARVIPNTIELDDRLDPPPPDLRAELGVGAGELMAVQPTRVVPRKGIEHAVELVRRLERPARLVVTGASGDEGHGYRAHIDSLARLLGVEVAWVSDRVGGHRDRRPDGTAVYSVDDVYAAADLVTYPSMVEGFGRAFLAAVRHRRPIVVNRYPIYDVDIRPLGFKVVEMDGYVTDETVAQTRSLLDEPGLWADWADHNLRLVRRHFSSDVLRRGLRAALVEMLD